MINDSGLVAGFWHTADSHNYVHSFFYKNGTYTSADVAKSIETGILFLDNAGDYAGRYTLKNGNWVGFAVIGGTMSTYVIPGSVKYNEARGVGPGGEVVGWYADASTTHGFLSIAGKASRFDVPGRLAPILRASTRWDRFTGFMWTGVRICMPMWRSARPGRRPARSE